MMTEQICDIYSPCSTVSGGQNAASLRQAILFSICSLVEVYVENVDSKYLFALLNLIQFWLLIKIQNQKSRESQVLHSHILLMIDNQSITSSLA